MLPPEKNGKTHDSAFYFDDNSPDSHGERSLNGRMSPKKEKIGGKNGSKNLLSFFEKDETEKPPTSVSKIDESFYFGENAKIVFFAKFRQLTVGLTSSTVLRPVVSTFRPHTG